MAKKTNTDLVLDLMNYSPYGGLNQVFVIEAIRHYSEQVLAQPRPSTPAEGDGTVHFINPQTWWDVAKDVNDRVVDNYEENK